MTAPRRFKDVEWQLPESDGRIATWEAVQLSVLMDIRDRLESIDASLRVLRCNNFIDIPCKLERIAGNTMKPTRKRVKGKVRK